MSSAHVIPTPHDEAPALSREEWWSLFDELRLAQQPAYAEHGGPIAFLGAERQADKLPA
jgi:hypothetical protein